MSLVRNLRLRSWVQLIHSRAMSGGNENLIDLGGELSFFAQTNTGLTRVFFNVNRYEEAVQSWARNVHGIGSSSQGTFHAVQGLV